MSGVRQTLVKFVKHLAHHCLAVIPERESVIQVIRRVDNTLHEHVFFCFRSYRLSANANPTPADLGRAIPCVSRTHTLFSIQISFCILALTIVTRSHLSKRALRNPQASEDLTGFLLLLHSLKRYHTVTACSPSINTQIHTHAQIFNATRSGSSGTLPHTALVSFPQETCS